MRHILAEAGAGPVPGLARRVAEAAGPTVLIQPAGGPQRGATGVGRAHPGAVAIPPVAEPAEEEDLPAVGAGTNDKPERVLHASPRAAREGMDNREDLCTL